MVKQITLPFLLFLLFFSLTQCRTYRPEPFRKQYKQVYIEQFKLTYLRELLGKSYNYSDAVREILRSDHSGFTEPLLTDRDYEIIDSLTTADNEMLKIDSINGRHRAEGAQGKRPLSYILGRIESKSLDRLARQRLRATGIPEIWRRWIGSYKKEITTISN